MGPMEEKVLANIHRQDLLDLTRRLVGIDTQNPPGDYTVCHRVMQDLYEGLGLETHVFQGAEGKPNVGGRWQGSGEKPDILMLSGHMDVVPVGTGWEVAAPLQPEVKEGRLIGRGVADMKGSLAAQYLAVKAVKESGVKLKGSLYLFATVDDETAGKLGLRYVVREGLANFAWPRPTFHILGEPTELKLCVAFKGRMWLRLTLQGKAAHGGNPGAGINAIEKMAKLIPAILALSRQHHPLMGEDTINIGTIAGGQKTNVVADSCTVTLDYRYVYPQTSAEVEARLKRVIAEAASGDPDIKLAGYEVFERREPLEVPQGLPQMTSLKALTEEVTGRPTAFNGVLSAGDSYWTITAGIPAVFYGPGSLTVAHTNKEYIDIAELEAAAKIFALYILRNLC